MNAGTCWGKNTKDPSSRGIEKPRKATLTFLGYDIRNFMIYKGYLVQAFYNLRDICILKTICKG
jgi:hypothetical protein